MLRQAPRPSHNPHLRCFSCPSARLTNNLTRPDACDLLTLLDYGLTDGGSGTPPRCDNPSVGPPDLAAPSGVLTPLQDRRPLPPTFDSDTAAELFGAEGATYYQL
jgi:hypothetical protein